MHCVPVSSYDAGDGGWDGQTSYDYSSSDHAFIDGSVSIVLNEHYVTANRAPSTMLSVTVHEIGHALGLGHSPSSSDVMYTCAACSGQTRPSSDDVGFLSTMYSIDR